MATIPPIQVGAAKITFPANLPKNEKDLICMILAGRLKDLLNGRLVCIELAIDDLIKDATGNSALDTLKTALTDLKDSVNELKKESGYDEMLAKVNQALGQIENVFSLGGLCATPVHAPKIPDVLATLNNQLFGQSMNILNSLGSVLNPSMCLGTGPGGIGMNWENFTGSLARLKSAIGNFGNIPGNVFTAFENNIKSQVRRMNAEIKRLQKNITDPFGINNAKQTANSIVAAKNKSDGYPIVGPDGVTRPNVMKSSTTPDMECLAENGDTTIVRVETKPVIDYCGDVIGFETISTVPGYEGWSSEPDALNQDATYILPVAQASCYDFNFIENDGLVFIYDSNGKIVNEMNISRGQFYRLGFHGITGIRFYEDPNCELIPYTTGIEYNQEAIYGSGFDNITPDNNTIYSNGFSDWPVQIQKNNETSPGVFDTPLLATPNTLYWRNMAEGSNQIGVINVSGTTEILYRHRAFDVAEAVRKAILHIKTTVDDIPVEETVTRNYTITSTLNLRGTSRSTTTTTEVNTSYFIETNDIGDTVVKSVQDLGGSKLTIVRVLDNSLGLSLKSIYMYESNDGTEDNATFMYIMNMSNPIDVPATTTLPTEDIYSYSGVLKDNNITIPVRNLSETSTFSLIQKGAKHYVRWNMTNFSETNKLKMEAFDFVCQTDIEIDYNDLTGSFTRTNPKQSRVYMYMKLPDNSYFETVIEID